MSIHKLFGLLVALAVLLSPNLSGAAMAAVPNHGPQMMQMGHCDSPPADSNHGKANAKNCCISMCMNVAVSPAGHANQAIVPRAAAVFGAATAYIGYLGEIATPPPRPA